MDKKFLAKIIATDNEGLQMISACCAGSKVRTADEAGNLSWPQNRYLNSTIKTYLIGT